MRRYLPYRFHCVVVPKRCIPVSLVRNILSPCFLTNKQPNERKVVFSERKYIFQFCELFNYFDTINHSYSLIFVRLKPELLSERKKCLIRNVVILLNDVKSSAEVKKYWDNKLLQAY